MLQIFHLNMKYSKQNGRYLKLRFELGISHIRNRIADHYTEKCSNSDTVGKL
jgi:hypothetical protein